MKPKQMSSFKRQIEISNSDQPSNRAIVGTAVETKESSVHVVSAHQIDRDVTMTFTAMDRDDCGEDSDPELVQLKILDYNAIFESEISDSGSVVATPQAAHLSIN